MNCETLKNLIGVKTVDRKAHMHDSRFLGRFSIDRQKLWPFTDPENNRLSLPCNNWQTEHALIPLKRTCGIGHAYLRVIDGSDRNR